MARRTSLSPPSAWRLPLAPLLLGVSLAAPAAARPQGPPGDGVVAEDGPAVDRPPPRGKGVIYGTVSDARGEPALEATVTVVGKPQMVVTNLEGQFRLELPPGRYDLRIRYELHQPSLVKGAVVTAGQLLRIDAKLSAEKDAVDTIEVETEADTSSTEGQLLKRKRAVAVGDSVGRAEIARTPDKNAAEAAKRLVGATIVGSRFVYVRGLGERYTNALCDGAPLPSPEPDRQTVPLDLFPALMLDGLTIVKTFTPDYPGDFAGGSVRIATRRLPPRLSFSASLGLGLNTAASFRQGLGYQGSSLDWLGIDGGARALPGSIPPYKIFRGGKTSNGDFISTEELVQHSRTLNAFMSTRRALVPPNHNGSLVFGQSWSLGGERRIGVTAALTYARNFEQRRDEQVRTFGLDTEGNLSLQNDLSVERGIDKVRWGGLVGVTLALSPRHRVHLTGLHSRSSDSEAQELDGFHEERGAKLHETRLSFVSRALTFGQLRVEHEIPELYGAKVDWNASISRADRDEPDTRSTVYQLDSTFGYAFEDDSQSGMHFFSEQGETTYGGGFDWTQPLARGEEAPKIKVGGLVSSRRRRFDARRFRFRPVPGADPTRLLCPVGGAGWDPTCPDQTFAAGNIGEVFQIEENTRANDAYTANLDVLAGYAMADVLLHPKLRLVLGERLEVSRQSLSSFDPFAPDAAPVAAELDSADPLPSVGLVWSPSGKTNLRFSLTRTLARPQLRELAPFSFTDFFGGREVQGNPELKLTRIVNADLRFELFPAVREVLAVSVFYKRFSDPVEQVIQSAGARGIVTFENADSASLTGVELEARKGLGFLHRRLADLSLIANLTIARSRVELDPRKAAFVTNTNRPLSHQAPYVVNLALDYDNDATGTRARVLYNVSGARLVQVGTSGLPDVYLQPRHGLDVTVAQRLPGGFDVKLTAENVLDSPVEETQGREAGAGNVLHRYSTGASVSLGASYSY